MKVKGKLKGKFGDFAKKNPIVYHAYDASSSVGKIGTILSTIFGNFVLFIILVIGIFMVRSKDTKTASINAIVTKATCNTSIVDKRTSTTCLVTIEYTVGEKKYTKDYTSYNVVNVDQTIHIRYDPANPNDFTAETVKAKTAGWIMIGLAIILMIGSWVWLWFVMSYKAAAAAAGVGIMADLAIPDN